MHSFPCGVALHFSPSWGNSNIDLLYISLFLETTSCSLAPYIPAAAAAALLRSKKNTLRPGPRRPGASQVHMCHMVCLPASPHVKTVCLNLLGAPGSPWLSLLSLRLPRCAPCQPSASGFRWGFAELLPAFAGAHGGGGGVMKFLESLDAVRIKC